VKSKDRKHKIEQTYRQAANLKDGEASQAWYRLCNELLNISEPEARPPRFNALLRAVWVAATNEQS
jgi:hypothetical protein